MRFQRETLDPEPNYEKVSIGLLTKANIGRRYWKDTRLADLPEESQVWAEKVADYIAHMHELEVDGVGLLLVGRYGRGKTAAACRVLMEAVARSPALVYFTRADDLDWVARNRDEMTPEGTRKWDLIERGAQFLVIDDLGSERQVDWNARWVEHVLSVRYDWKLPTIVTSNIPMDDLYKQAARLKQIGDSYRVVEVVGPDLRS